MFKHELGDEIVTIVQQLKGIVTYRAECLYGSNIYFIQPKVNKEGHVSEGYWVDEEDVFYKGVSVAKKGKKRLGGPKGKGKNK